MGRYGRPTLLVLLFAWLGTWWELPYKVGDAVFYIALADGRWSEVGRPFSQRVLHPFLVRLTPLSTDNSFFVWGIILLALLTAGMFYLHTHTIDWDWKWTAALCLFTPWTLELFRNYYLPDLLHSTLLIGYFILLFKRQWLWSAVLCFLLYLTRESTILLVLVVLPIAALKREWRLGLSTAAALILAMAASTWSVSTTSTNAYDVGGFVYLALKVPFNALQNLLGINLLNPPIMFDLPAWIPVQQVAIGRWLWERPLYTLTGWLSLFGIMPLLLVAQRRKGTKKPLNLTSLRLCARNSEPYLLIALIYGILSYLLGPMLGASLNRLISYGWPALWLAAPVLVHERLDFGRLIPIHLLTCWAPALIAYFLPLPYSAVISTVCAIVLWIVAVRLIQQNDNN